MKRNVSILLILIVAASCSSNDSAFFDGHQENQDHDEHSSSVSDNFWGESTFFEQERSLSSSNPNENVEKIFNQLPEREEQQKEYYPSISELEIEEDNKPQEYTEYVIKPGDTLMLIAWSVYGDYQLWREILKENPHDARRLITGNTLIIKNIKRKNAFHEPKGIAYIIQRNDTLGSISKDKYGTFRKWKKIYQNNRSLIRDPDLIFTGFTIFYEPEPNLGNAPKLPKGTAYLLTSNRR